MPYKHHDNCYRNAGERVCWSDGLRDDITAATVAHIRAQGFKAWRTKNTVWVRAEDAEHIRPYEWWKEE